MKYPKLIENHYLDALKQTEKNDVLFSLYKSELSTPRSDIQKLMDDGDIYAMEDAISHWQTKRGNGFSYRLPLRNAACQRGVRMNKLTTAICPGWHISYPTI